MHNGNGQSAAQIEREVDAQRQRIESTIGEIREKLSPGQLVDEILAHTKDGGQEFVGNLGRTAASNPLPTALLGVSLAWLMFGQKQDSGHGGQHVGQYGGHHASPSLAHVTGDGLQRVTHAQDDLGDWYSEFIDEAGKKYRAKSNELGHRAGHFLDETGKQVSGFVNEAGHQVDAFRDEAGNVLDQSMGWAAQSWQDAADSVSHTLQQASDGAAHLSADMRQQASRVADGTMRAFQDQPLIAGALAFAAGAALATTLPSTRQEDEAVGEYADGIKREAAQAAGDMYEKGKQEAAHVYDEASQKAGEIYSDAKSRIAGDDDRAADGAQRPH